MTIPLLLFFAGLLLLFKGADFLVDGAELLAVRIGVPSALIGLTVVAFGTSLPELVVSTGAFFTGSYEIGIGTLIGSNIANIGLILALCFLMIPPGTSTGMRAGISYSRQHLLRDAVLTLIAALVFAVASLRGVLDIFSAFVFLLVFVLIIHFSWKAGQSIIHESQPDVSGRNFLIPFGLAGVILGSYLLLTGAKQIALLLDISPYVIGLSMVAVGTSLPELSTSVIAALKKNYDISIGNILGSNVFNILFIPGVSALFLKISVTDYWSTLVMIIFSLGLFPLFMRSQIMAKCWAGILLTAWIAYIAIIYRIF